VRGSIWKKFARLLALVSWIVALPACAAGMVGGLPGPDEIPDLEGHLARDATSVPTMIRLGVAYREANRLGDARGALERAVALEPNDPAAVFYLGLTYEDLELPGAARDLYTRYLQVGTRGDVRTLVRRRLPIVERQEFVLAARDALAREAELATVQPAPRTVAIFPFLYAGTDPQLRPLGRALAEMLATDLSQTDRLTVVERSQVQLLLDEIRLSREPVSWTR
jgi:tetratricopeptide (TPR) repeat protein